MKKLKIGEWTADKVKTLRAKNKLSQSDFAAMIGVTQQLIQRLEAGKHEISPMTAIALDWIKEHMGNGGCSPREI